ncbi:TerB family tellurite resistance protein [Notoacmeibacter sp. MSK16QG-6]|uniref:tellurite resistance TerB family protein n=1 Tax=Notoacmeibacter sp. MSK16QG-6 TaxID=2957982 RepID=UPI0020A18B75|nr:TerB family tellurite resistance protein [Notoacmeibacter sp. MSK16QG-6]MCP1199244.1 TerB family tellurite resistance protein [Notoacmeibacter sp. MSK16QG-6]
MLQRLTELFRLPDSANEKTSESDIRRAAAALLVILMDADGIRQPEEEARLRANLAARFGLDEERIEALVAEGKSAAAESADFYAFTSVLKREFEIGERNDFIGMLWEMAYADGMAHELEDNLVWRISELMGVAGRERIHQRQDAVARLGVSLRPRPESDESAPQSR